MNENKRILTQNELNAIMNLPTKVFLYCGTEKIGKFNQEDGKFYLLNDNGTLSGKVATLSKEQQYNLNNMETNKNDETLDKKDNISEEYTYEENNMEKDENEVFSNNNNFKKIFKEKLRIILENKKILFGIISGILILAITIICLILLLPKQKTPLPPPVEINTEENTENDNQINDENNDNDEEKDISNKNDNTDENTNNENNDEQLEYISVIQVTKNLLPGDIISDKNIQESKISAETYNLINLMGNTNNRIYQWDTANVIKGQYVTSYIPAGEYVTYGNIADVKPVYINPWINESEEMVYISAPLTETTIKSDMNFGSYFDLKIQKQTILENSNDSEQEETTEDDSTNIGIEHETSITQQYVIDTYSIKNLIVCDILNNNNESLFDYYIMYDSIPSGERLIYLENLLSNKSNQEKLQPKFIKFKISKKQYEMIGDLTKENIILEYMLTGEINNNNENKAKYATLTRAITNNIKNILNKINEVQANEN